MAFLRQHGRRLLSVFLVLAYLLSLNVQAASANGTWGDNLSWSLSGDGVLSISGTGEMADVPSGSSAPWAAYSDSIKSVKIASGVTSIGNWAFFCCTNMTLIQIPASVTRIGAWALAGCTQLTTVQLPDSVTVIEDGAFSICSGLTSVKLSKKLTQISEAAFYDCKKLSEITFRGNAPAIAGTAFQNVTATVYYSEDTKGWTSNTMSNYGGQLTWKKQTPVVYDNPFQDVKAGAYYETPVLWAVSKNITNGMSATTFAPDEKCVRAQVVTFLWRAAGEPEPVGSSNPFVDVKEKDYFYKAVLWAVEQGITNGMDATHFGSQEKCTRGQVATFLWRSQGEPKATDRSNPFTDIKEKDYFYEAVLWAVEAEVTNGMSATTFAPNSTCTRGQIVTFLYRALR